MDFNKCLGCMEDFRGYPCPNCGYDPASAVEAGYVLPPKTILFGKYLVGKVLGQGGFGITYVGWDLALERKVAIKEYYPSGQVSRVPGERTLTWYVSENARQARQGGMEMFLKEARKMAKVDHIPGVVRVREIFRENDTAYIVMDFVEGETLKARLKRTGPLSWDHAKEIFLPAIRAMERVHQAGLVHRDLSPDNLMLTSDGKVMVLDLGAAKDLSINNGASSMQVAKGGFSPLEQYTQRGGSGPWTDVYAMAATMYYTLTGTLPPSAVDRVSGMEMSWDLPQLAGVPPYAVRAMKKALAPKPEDRTQTMGDFAQQLQNAGHQASQPEKKKEAKQEIKKPRPGGNQKKAAAIAAAVVVLGLGLGSVIARRHQKADPSGSTQGSSGSQTENWGSAIGFYMDYQKLMESCQAEITQVDNLGNLTAYLDADGRERIRVYSDLEGSRAYIFTADYDDAGNIIREQLYDGEGQLQRQVDTEWTADKRILKRESSDGTGKLLSSLEYTLDAQGRYLSAQSIGRDGKITSKGAYTYAADGSYSASFTDAEGNLKREERYDADGNETSYRRYKEDGTVDTWLEYSYDSDGNRIKQIQYNKASGKPEFETEFAYEGGQLVQEVHYWYGKQSSTWKYAYNSRGLRLNCCRTDESGDTLLTRFCSIGGTMQREFSEKRSDSTYARDSISQYNWEGRIETTTYYDKSGECSGEQEYHYDSQEEFTGYTYTSYSSDGKRYVSEYNEEYDIISSVVYTGDGTKESWTEYSYSGNTRTGMEYDASGALKERTECVYNDNGDELESKNYDANGKLTSERRSTYDASGRQTGSSYTYYYNDSYSVSEYDADHNNVSWVTYNNDGSKRNWTEYSYSGNTRTDMDYDASGTLTGRTEHQYKENGDELWSRSYDADGSLRWEQEYSYDENGSFTGYTSTWYHQWNGGKTVTQYDENYDRVSEKKYDEDGALISSE